MEKVTLYIPCFNAGQYLSLSLRSVFDQSYPVDEVLVIDDGSTDDTVMIASQFPVRVISHGVNRGLAVARNTAFTEARNEFVAALDADCVAEKEWLAELMKMFKDETTMGLGGRLIEGYSVTAAGQWRARHMPQHWGEIEMEDPPFLFGCNTVMRRRAVLSLGAYNVKFRTNYEDVDLSQRILENDRRLIYSPAAVVRHLRRDTVRSVLRSFWQWNYDINQDKIRRSKHKFCAYVNMVAHLAPDFFSSDLREARYKILIIDILVFIYLPWLDIIHCFRTWRDK